MASLKAIRTRIASIRSTQKITRAMKTVAGARLARAQDRILAMRPYAIKTHTVLATCAGPTTDNAHGSTELPSAAFNQREGSKGAFVHPLLAERPEKSALFLILTSDRGLCGAFNANINRAMEREWHRRQDLGQTVHMAIVGRKGLEYFSRREAPILVSFKDVAEDISFERARLIGKSLLEPFLDGRVDAIYLVYNEFQSAMTQRVAMEPLLPVRTSVTNEDVEQTTHYHLDDFLFEPNREALLDRLVPMYVEISVLRALLESNASEHGARMTAMDAATENAKEIIASLTLQYNRARQAAITTELSEIIGGAEALKG